MAPSLNAFMKLIVMSCFLFYSDISRAQDIRRIRGLYRKAGNSESACKDLLVLITREDEQTHALMAGYKGAASMIMAKFAINPITKLAWFRKGRELLDKAIESDKGCVELRYLRYGVQLNSPRFLGYNASIRDDRACLQEAIEQNGDAELKSMIGEVLKKGA